MKHVKLPSKIIQRASVNSPLNPRTRLIYLNLVVRFPPSQAPPPPFQLQPKENWYYELSLSLLSFLWIIYMYTPKYCIILCSVYWELYPLHWISKIYPCYWMKPYLINFSYVILFHCINTSSFAFPQWLVMLSIFFMNLLAIYMFALEKCVFRSFAHFYLQYLCLFAIEL